MKQCKIIEFVFAKSFLDGFDACPTLRVKTTIFTILFALFIKDLLQLR